MTHLPPCNMIAVFIFAAEAYLFVFFQLLFGAEAKSPPPPSLKNLSGGLWSVIAAPWTSFIFLCGSFCLCTESRVSDPHCVFSFWQFLSSLEALWAHLLTSIVMTTMGLPTTLSPWQLNKFHPAEEAPERCSKAPEKASKWTLSYGFLHLLFRFAQATFPKVIRNLIPVLILSLRCNLIIAGNTFKICVTTAWFSSAEHWVSWAIRANFKLFLWGWLKLKKKTQKVRQPWTVSLWIDERHRRWRGGRSLHQ